MGHAELLLIILLHSVAVGLIASVYRHVLAYERPFTLWWQWGAQFENRWFFKPIWGCEKCFAGQLALWGYLSRSILHLFEPQVLQISIIYTAPAIALVNGGFWLFGLLLAISGAILSALFFTWVLKKIN